MLLYDIHIYIIFPLDLTPKIGPIKKLGKHFKCPLCQFSSIHRHMLKNHYFVHVRIHREEKPPLEFQICSKRFGDLDQIEIHHYVHIKEPF